MKILVATHRAYPTLGGLEKHVYKVAQKTSKKEDVEILNLAFSQNNYKKNVNEKFTIKGVGSLFILNGAYPFPLLSSFKYLQEIKKFGPDLIHTHGRYFISTLLAAIYAKWHKIPLIHTEHIEGELYFKNRFQRRVVNKAVDFLSQWLFRLSSRITAVSGATQSFLKTRYQKSSILVPNFIDTDEIDAALKHPLSEYLLDSLSKEYLNVLFPYRLVESKGYKYVIELAKIMPEVNFIIAGEGEGRKVVEKITRELKNLKYCGGIEHTATMGLMNKVDIVLNFSKQEGLSTTLMEAVYLRKKILSTDIDSNKEVLKGYPGVKLINIDKIGLEGISQELRKLISERLTKAGNIDIPTLSESSEMYYDIYKQILLKK